MFKKNLKKSTFKLVPSGTCKNVPFILRKRLKISSFTNKKKSFIIQKLKVSFC